MKIIIKVLVALSLPALAWEVDFSRRSKPQQLEEVKPVENPKTFLHVKRVVPESVVRTSVVILNTENGFVPDKVRIFKGQNYLVHVVNVNENRKNISFMLDAFKEHHATYFGKIRTFKLDPEKEGVFEYQCPETAALGKVIVLGPEQTKIRLPATE